MRYLNKVWAGENGLTVAKVTYYTKKQGFLSSVTKAKMRVTIDKIRSEENTYLCAEFRNLLIIT